MITVTPGQLDIFDLLEADKPQRTNSQRDRSPVTYSDMHFVPTPENPVYCVMCGAKMTHYFDYAVNHSPLGWLAGQRMCTAMNLTLNHVKYELGRLVNALSGEPVAQCCWDKTGLHGKAIRKPTAEQIADHLRWQIDHTRSKWGIRAELFDEWVVASLIDRGVLSHTKYHAKWLSEAAPDAPVRLPFTVTTGPGKYDGNFCAYCGTTSRLNEGSAGPATGGVEPAYWYQICDPCTEWYRGRKPPSDLWTFKEML